MVSENALEAFRFRFLFLCFQGDTKLGVAAGTDYKDLLSVFGKLAESASVKDVVASEGLQKKLLENAGDSLLMHGFIGRCKAIMNESQQSPPAPSVEQPGDIFFFFLFFCFFTNHEQSFVGLTFGS